MRKPMAWEFPQQSVMCAPAKQSAGVAQDRSSASTA
jgi:hypothetical protein